MIKEKILNAIPKSRWAALTMSELSDKLSEWWTLYNEHLIRKNVKKLRSEWHKIIWCSKWNIRQYIITRKMMDNPEQDFKEDINYTSTSLPTAITKMYNDVLNDNK